MNINEYKEQEALKIYPIDMLQTSKNCFDDMNEMNRFIWKKGFDCAINLRLAVKFAEWYMSKEESWKNWRKEHYILKDNVLINKAYNYWVENILKIEQ